MIRQRLGLAALTVMAIAAACGKAEQPKPVVPADQTAAPGVGLPGAPTETLATTDKVKLAKDFTTIRCQIIGYAAPLPKVYTELGYGSAREFADAFEAAAKLDRDWARATVAASYAQPCPGGKPVLGAAAATPTAAPAAATGTAP
jgi:hypothetical protein